jgi:hypothetical protein
MPLPEERERGPNSGYSLFLNITESLAFVHRPVFKDTSFRQLDLFPSSGARKGASRLLGPLERASLNHWTTNSEQQYVCKCLRSGFFNK